MMLIKCRCFAKRNKIDQHRFRVQGQIGDNVCKRKSYGNRIDISNCTSAYNSASSFTILDTNFSVTLSNEMNVVESVLLSTWTCILYLFQLQSCQYNVYLYYVCICKFTNSFSRLPLIPLSLSSTPSLLFKILIFCNARRVLHPVKYTKLA